MRFCEVYQNEVFVNRELLFGGLVNILELLFIILWNRIILIVYYLKLLVKKYLFLGAQNWEDLEQN